MAAKALTVPHHQNNQAGKKNDKKAFDSHTIALLHRKEALRKRQHEYSVAAREGEEQAGLQAEVDRLTEVLRAQAATIGAYDAVLQANQRRFNELNEVVSQLEIRKQASLEKAKSIHREIADIKEQSAFGVVEVEDLQLQIKCVDENAATKEAELEKLSGTLALHAQKAFSLSTMRKGEQFDDESAPIGYLKRIAARLEEAETPRAGGKSEPDRNPSLNADNPLNLPGLASSEPLPVDDAVPRRAPLSDEVRAEMVAAPETIRRMLRDSKEKVSCLQELLGEQKRGGPMHSNLTSQMKATLAELTREQILLLMDCLSFEQTVFEYLQVELYDGKDYQTSPY